MYAPVSTIAVREEGHRLIGYAAPAGGPAPCLLRLTADDVPIAAARATAFSKAARAASLRQGWCGIELPGLAVAAALGSRIEVRCGVSGRVLWHRKAYGPIAGPAIRGTPLSVFEIVALSRKADAASDLKEIEPFMRHHLLAFGTASFVNATFGTFLGRSPESQVIEYYEGRPGENLMTTVVQTVMNSEEYQRIRLRFIPGPFNAAFRYSLEALD